MSDAPNWVDYATLGAASVAALTAPVLKIWEALRQEKDKFTLNVDWAFDPHGEVAEWPALHIHNRSTQKILITEVRFSTGIILRKPRFGTAVLWGDPTDLPFPATVEPGSIRVFALNDDGASAAYRKIGLLGRAAAILHRSFLWIEVLTASGATKRISGEPALTWKERPSWLKLEKDD